jgi:hypothetical protein
LRVRSADGAGRHPCANGRERNDDDRSSVDAFAAACTLASAIQDARIFSKPERKAALNVKA